MELGLIKNGKHKPFFLQSKKQLQETHPTQIVKQ
jgi:hypothetical protein